MAQITYENKVKINDSSLPSINKVRDVDMNEIKEVVNANDTESQAYFEKITPTVLYENQTGTTSSGNLIDDYSNYEFIEVYGKNGNIYGYGKLEATNENRVGFIIPRPTGSNVTFYSVQCTFNANAFSLIGASIALNGSGIAGFAGANEVTITKIIGYK